nr:MAG TPA: hypothetical protein [Caudoviricetes sp.]
MLESEFVSVCACYCTMLLIFGLECDIIRY